MTRKKGFPVIRIVDGIPYLGQAGTTFTVRAHELGNGHVEMSAVRDTEWKELEWDAYAMETYLRSVEEAKITDAADILARRIKIAANRAKTRVRRLCKAMGADTLLTLTYRFNELDLAQVKKDLKEFNRRMVRVMPTFRFVAAFEQQDRGAWHVHMATAGIPMYFFSEVQRGTLTGKKTGKVDKVMSRSYDVIRAIWRSITKERGGNIDVSRKKRHSRSTPAQIASYLSKYILKDFEKMAKGTNRFAAYGDFEIPEPVNMGRVSNALEALEVCYSVLGGRVVFNQHLSRWGDWFFLHGESVPNTCQN